MSTSLTHSRLMASWPSFCQQITAFLHQLGLDTLQLEIDHVALRVNDEQTAKQLSHEFCKQGTIISSNIINGRPIEIIELNTPLKLNDNTIECIELPYPSDKQYPVEGWEHIELVLNSKASDCEQLVKDLVSAQPDIQTIIEKAENRQGDIKIKLSSPKGDKERLANPTIAFKQDNLCIKVHPHGIKAVIASEQR